MKRAEAELRAIRMEEIRQTSFSSPPAPLATSISGSSGASTAQSKTEKSDIVETDLTLVLKKKNAEPDQEKPKEVLENIPEGVAHIRTNPLPQPPPTAINQHQHTDAANTNATGRVHSNRKAAAMRARRSYSANSQNI